MVPSTPSRSSDDHDNDHDELYTRPMDATSPSQLNLHSKRRKQASVLSTRPPPLALGHGARTSTIATSAIISQLDEADRQSQIRRKVWAQFATAADSVVDQQKEPEARQYAEELAKGLISFLQTRAFITPFAASPGSIDPPSSSAKSVTWADRVSRGVSKTLTNPEKLGSTTAKKPQQQTRPSTSGTSRVSLNSSTGDQPARVRQDHRLLITSAGSILLNRPNTFVLRQEIAKSIPGLTKDAIKDLTPTRTGWALHPIDLKTRDLLTTQESVEVLRKVLGATAVRTPEKWYNYAVQNVPATVPGLLGDVLHCPEHMEDEVFTQTRVKPISTRPSRHGANPATGKQTWIISFLQPVKGFTLFGVSAQAKLIDKKPAILRHDPGCQGFCNPLACTRHARCNHCGNRTQDHDGPTGPNCKAAPQCANCHGPYAADHPRCPAAPRRVNGKVIRPTKKELEAVRRLGDAAYSVAVTPITEAPTPQNDNNSVPNNAGRKKKRGDAVTAHEQRTTAPLTTTLAAATTPNVTSTGRPIRNSAPKQSLNIQHLGRKAYSTLDDTASVASSQGTLSSTPSEATHPSPSDQLRNESQASADESGGMDIDTDTPTL